MKTPFSNLKRVRGGSLVSAPVTADLVQAFSAIRGEPEWLRSLRLEGWETFSSSPMPTLSTEGWRRMDLRSLDIDELLNPPAQTLPGAPISACAREVMADRAEVSATLVVQDTGEVVCDLNPDLPQRGVRVMSLDRAIRECPELVQPHLGSVCPPSGGKFLGLHHAFMSGGAFVHVPRGVVLEKAIQVVHAATEPGQSAFPHTLIVGESGSEFTVLDTYCADESVGEVLASSAVEIVPMAGARIRYVNTQEWSEQAWHFNSMAAGSARDSFVGWVLASLGGHIGRVELSELLNAQGAETEIVGLVFAEASQHIDHITLQDHLASRTRSDLIFKVALRDHASSNFTGLIRVDDDASQTSSNMEARNLLLSGTSKAEADPRLEILNADVERCSHGATVGPMDQDVLFYVMSRGIGREEAQRLIIEAFFDPVLRRVPVTAVRDRIWSSIQRELDDN